MFAETATTKKLTLKDFIQTNFESDSELILFLLSKLNELPVNIFSRNNYKLSHLLMSKILYLQSNKLDSEVPYLILHFFSRLFSDFSSLDIKRNDVFHSLISYFNLDTITEAKLTKILVNQEIPEDQNELFMKESLNKLGYLNPHIGPLYPIVKEALKLDASN